MATLKRMRCVVLFLLASACSGEGQVAKQGSTQPTQAAAVPPAPAATQSPFAEPIATGSDPEGETTEPEHVEAAAAPEASMSKPEPPAAPAPTPEPEEPASDACSDYTGCVQSANDSVAKCREELTSTACQRLAENSRCLTSHSKELADCIRPCFDDKYANWHECHAACNRANADCVENIGDAGTCGPGSYCFIELEQCLRACEL